MSTEQGSTQSPEITALALLEPHELSPIEENEVIVFARGLLERLSPGEIVRMRIGDAEKEALDKLFRVRSKIKVVIESQRDNYESRINAGMVLLGLLGVAGAAILAIKYPEAELINLLTILSFSVAYVGSWIGGIRVVRARANSLMESDNLNERALDKLATEEYTDTRQELELASRSRSFKHALASAAETRIQKIES